MHLNREWRIRSEQGLGGDVLLRLREETGLSSLTLRACLARGLGTAADIGEFLAPKLETLTSPLKLKDMDLAIDRLARARAKQELVWVYGDYDVDGTTGAALLSWVLREHGIRFEARQPDRFKDGYGLNTRAVEEAASQGAGVLLTVDCGITSFDAAKKADELGLDLIVVDHHQLDAMRGMPRACAIINPQRPDCESGLKQLCGCGLAFYLAMALRARGRAEGWFASGAEPNLKQHLDLVVMATAADMVPLTGDNHILVRHGLEVLKRSTKPGVRALLEVAGVGARDLSPGHLGFVIGPRINASGRMQSASLALEMLTTKDGARAIDLARELEKLNRERADIQNQIWDQIRERVEQGISQGRFKNGIVVADPGWHEGVIGIVASRVTESFHRPAAVIALREDYGKGSVRSYAGKDVLGALRASAASLMGFGGHKHAAGLTVALDRVEEFSEAFDRALGEIPVDSSAAALWVDGPCEIEDLDVMTLQEIERLGPFGPGNPEPVFTLKGRIRGPRILKERHLKFQLAKVEESSSVSGIDAIWFHAAENQEMTEEFLGTEVEWAGVPELNRFRGQMTPTVRIKARREIAL